MGTEKFHGKYRIESARKKGYDYSQNGAYFITIVTKNRECFFGDVVNTPNLGVSTVQQQTICKKNHFGI